MLFRSADDKYGGRQPPIPEHFLLDEFANIALPSDFEKVLSVMRSRNISVSVILQALEPAQAALYGFVGDYSEQSGRSCSIWAVLRSVLMSISPSGWARRQSTQIPMVEVGAAAAVIACKLSADGPGAADHLMRSDGWTIDRPFFFIRGEKPVLDSKFVLEHHPNAKQMNAPPYRHGAVASWQRAP